MKLNFGAGRAAYAVVIFATLATYANVYGNAWLFDDEFLVLKNTFLDSFASIGRMFQSSSTAGAGFHDLFYRPVQGLAYLAVNQAFGRAPWAFHALNVITHVANACLVLRLGRRILPTAAALAGALLWAVHPLHVEAVTYVSATADPLHAFFVLAALNVTAFGRSHGDGDGGAAHGDVGFGVALFVLGLLTKESAIVMPALLGAVIFATDPRRFDPRAYRRVGPFAAIAVMYVIARKTVLSFGPSLSFFTAPSAYADHLGTRVWTALATLPAYAELIFWPHDLHMDREFPTYADPIATPVLIGAGLVASAGGLLWRARARPTPPRVLAAAAVLWIAGAHAPHSGVALPVNSVFLEHWMYLTSVPVCLAVGAVITRAPARWAVALTAIVTTVLAQKTWRQNQVWATPVRFFEHTLAYSPKSARIRHNLAMAYLEADREDEGLTQLELMIAARTPYPATYHTAAHAYLRRGDFDRAEPYFLRALELDPNFYPSAQELALLYEARGDAARARAFATRARALRP